MKLTVAPAVAFALAMAATTASAGVVISQVVTTTDQMSAKRQPQTVMVQGRKERVVTGDHTMITDLDAGYRYVLDAKSKQFVKIVFPPKAMYAQTMAFQGETVGYRKGQGTGKQAGFSCDNYEGLIRLIGHAIAVKECVASGAPGAKEYNDYWNAYAGKVKGTAVALQNGVIPDGIPVKRSAAMLQMMDPLPPKFDAKAAEQMKAKLEAANKHPHTVDTLVSKIEVKDIAADEFAVPADYKEQSVQPAMRQVPGLKRPVLPAVPTAAPSAGAK